MALGGLVALLDDIALIADDVAKMTMSVADDIGAVTVKASQKAAGIVTDDLAVTAEQMTGIRRDREWRVIWGVAKGSFKNKMLFLIPGALFLTVFAPWALPPLLVAGGAFLCFEGAEKLIEKFHPKITAEIGMEAEVTDPMELERTRVAEAIRTDMVLSGEIMIMGLNVMQEMGMNFGMTALSLVVFGTFMTAAVYGTVALLVKIDDLGEALALRKHTRKLGQMIVLAAPKLLHLISWVGLIAMLAVGGHLVAANIPPVKQAMQGIVGVTPSFWVGYGSEIIFGFITGLVVVAALATRVPQKVIGPLVRLVGRLKKKPA